jgi:hypothetical protein
MSAPVAREAEKATESAEALRVVDLAVRHDWASQNELMPYLSSGWQEYVGVEGTLPDGGGAIPVLPKFPYHRLRHPPSERSATNAAEVVRDLLAHPRSQALLVHDRAPRMASLPNAQLSRALIRAANDWTVEQWLDTDPRLSAAALVPSQIPEAAAEEIRRVGRHPRIVGVVLGDNGLGKPFGHPAYRPIHEAAAELGLVLVLADGTDTTPDNLTSPVGGGMPATYAEYKALCFQTVQTHLVSLIGQGVLERHPGLRVLVIGGGLAWAPALLWRLDNEYRALRRETPWLTKLPSEYFVEHVRVATYPLDRVPDPEVLGRVLRLVPGYEDTVCFGSGYPAFDADEARRVAAVVDPGFADALFWKNAEALLGARCVTEVRQAEER